MRVTLPEGLVNTGQFWRLTVGGWSIFASFGFLVRLVVNESPWRAFVFTALQEPIAVAFSVVLWIVYRRPEMRAPFGVGTAAWLIGLSLTAAIAQAAIAQVTVESLGWEVPGWSEREGWMIRIIFIWLMYMAWSLGYFGLRAQEAARRMELRLLRSRLDPHFLFNSLNGVAAEIRPHPDAAVEMVGELAEYLRYSLDNRNVALTPLGDELDAMEDFLRIEQARFGSRLETTVEATPAARQRLVPSFLLQPLVENAVKYAMRTAAPPWKINVAVKNEGRRLRVEVSNSGKMEPSAPTVSGVGLETLRRRLALHYPGRHHFDLREGDGLVAAVLELEGEPCSA
jgi:hypothetical protein